MDVSTEKARDSVEVELILSLFSAVTPPLIMSALFVMTALMACMRLPDLLLVWLSAAGVLASGARLAVLLSGRREVRSSRVSIDRARELERRFAVSYIAFAIVLGLFAGHLLSLRVPETFMLTVSLLVGYSAGVAAGVGLRPKIAIPSMLSAVVPAAFEVLSWGDPFYIATSLALAALLTGGSHSIICRERWSRREIGQKIAFAGLARQDALTALPNRLALREWFEANMLNRNPSDGFVAVHCLDLNGFKTINDRFGHPVGDELLRAVSGKLARALREGDIAARIGGDEFVIVQSCIRHRDEAELLAKRLCKGISQPFRLSKQVVEISTCVGFVISDDFGENLEELMWMADEALYLAKRGDSEVVQFVREPQRQSELATCA